MKKAARFALWLLSVNAAFFLGRAFGWWEVYQHLKDTWRAAGVLVN